MLPIKDLYFSTLLGQPVLDAMGERVGRVKDLVCSPGEVYPRVACLVVRDKGRDRWYDLYQVQTLTPKLVALKVAGRAETPRRVEGLFLARDLLDKQVVDIHGAKVVRVNDLRLTALATEVRLVAIDISFRGLLRRIGLEMLGLRIAERLGGTLPLTSVGWEWLEPLGADSTGLRLAAAHQKLKSLHPADIAEILTELSLPERQAIFRSLDSETASETLSEVEPELQPALVDSLSEGQVTDLMEAMPADEAADLLANLAPERAAQILKLMPAEDVEQVRKLLNYREHSTGSLMTTEFITFTEDYTADGAIAKLRQLAPDAETIYYLYVVDDGGRLTGVLSLRDLIVAAPTATVGSIMTRRVIAVQDTDPVRQVADVMNRYNLLAVPVVNEEQVLLGVATIDDVLSAVYPRRQSHGRNPRRALREEDPARAIAGGGS